MQSAHPHSEAGSPPPEKDDERKGEGNAFLKNIRRIVSLGKPTREDAPAKAEGAIMVQGGGTLACCPLKSETYQKVRRVIDVRSSS